MTTGASFDFALVVLLVGLAGWTVRVRDSSAAVAGFIAYGLLLTLAWVRLQGVDVALTEAAIGGGLTGALLIGAVSKLRRGEAAVGAAERAKRPLRWLAAGCAALVAMALALVVWLLPHPAPTLTAEVAADIGAIGVGNPITAVLLGFRALDTLLEAIVLVFALAGVWSLAPDRFWGGRPGRAFSAERNGILAYAAKLLPPVGVIVASYIFWIGADLPGGKFQGATLLAAMWLLVLMAGLADAPPIGRRWLRAALVVGPLAFVAVGIVGALFAGAFLAYPPGLAKALVLVVEFALLPTLTVVLGLLLLGAPLRPVA